MREENYKKMLEIMGKDKFLRSFAVYSGKIITYAVYIFYPAFLLYLGFLKNEFLLRCISVPAVSFVAVSVIRYLLNFERPYEKFDLTPLYDKKTKGRSFPSRHTFSVFIIGFTVFYVYPAAGIAVLVLGVILALSRVLCGVHFIKDVLAGCFFAVLSAFIGFYLI